MDRARDEYITLDVRKFLDMNSCDVACMENMKSMYTY